MDSKKINETVIYLHRLEHENEAIQTIEQLESDYLKNQNWNKFIKPGSVTIDIGAHSGDTLIPLIIAGSNNLKCKTKILAFEPNKVVFDTCKKNVDSNLSDLVDIKLFPFAIIDEDDKDLEFSDHGNNMCNGGIIHDNMNLLISKKDNTDEVTKYIYEKIKDYNYYSYSFSVEHIVKNFLYYSDELNI